MVAQKQTKKTKISAKKSVTKPTKMKTAPRKTKVAKQDAKPEKPVRQVMKAVAKAKVAKQDAKPAKQVMKAVPKAKPARQVMKAASKANVVAKVEKPVKKAVAKGKGVKQVKKAGTKAKPVKEVMKTASKAKPAKPAVMKAATLRGKGAKEVMKRASVASKPVKEVMKNASVASKPVKEVMKKAGVASKPVKEVMKRASVASKPKSAKASGKTVRKPSSRKASSKKASSVPASPRTTMKQSRKSTPSIKVTKSPSKASTPKKQSLPASPAASPLLVAPTVATPKTPPVSVLAPVLSTPGAPKKPTLDGSLTPTPAPSSETRMVTKSFRGKIPVDDYVPNAHEFIVYEDKEATWACMLNQSNVGANNNKFYVIQLLTRGSGFYVWKRWGRVGVQGQSEFSSFNDVFSAKNEFASKFRSKTGVSWQNRKSAVPAPGKYAFIEMDYEVPDATVAKNTDYEPCKLPSEVQSLIKLICDVDMMKKSLIEVGYDAKKMPLGKISPAMVTAGYEKLKEIEAELDGRSKIEELQRLSSEFFTVIPHDFGFKQMSEFTINGREKLKEKLELVEALSQIEVAQKLLTEELNSKENPITKKYEMLNCGLTPLKRGGSEWKMVETYAQNTHGDTHSYYRLVLKNLFEVDKPNSKFDAFKDQSNRQLLWHGSRLTNWVGILNQGLRIAPPEAPVSGYMFGKGVYFADCISKSANYCNVQAGGTGLLFLCEVALGHMNEKLQADYHASNLPRGKLSTKGIGRNAPCSSTTMADGMIIPNGRIGETRVKNASLWYNEFIVYDTDQIRPRYLCEFEFRRYT